MADLRQKCLNCGKLHGVHDIEWTHEYYELGQPVPPYDGPHLLLKEVINPALPLPGQKDDPGSQALRIDRPTEEDRKDIMKWWNNYNGRFGREVVRYMWDGESWLKPDVPYCSFECRKKHNPTFWQQVQERNKNKD